MGMAGRSHYLEHRKRLRERFRKTGAEGLHDYELLELLLTYAIPRKDVKPVVKELIKRFGGLAGFMDATQKELEAVPGLGFISATLIRLVKELCGAYLAERMRRKDVLSSSQAVVDFVRAKLGGSPHEAFMVIYPNTENEVMGHEIVYPPDSSSFITIQVGIPNLPTRISASPAPLPKPLARWTCGS